MKIERHQLIAGAFALLFVAKAIRADYLGVMIAYYILGAVFVWLAIFTG